MRWHVHAGDENGNAYTVFFHLPVPAGNNRAGFPIQQALINSGLGGKSQMTSGTAADQIDPAELAAVQAGSVYEYAATVATNPGETGAQLAARLDALYTTLADPAGRALSELKARLNTWGARASS